MMTIEEKRELFALRNRMTDIPNNFGKKEEKCVCGTLETMSHIYSCESLNQTKKGIHYNQIYNIRNVRISPPISFKIKH